MSEEITEPVHEASEEVPVKETDPPVENHPEENDDRILGAIEAMGNRIVEAINSAKEASPVTPAEEEVLDQTPIRKPWTHRGFGRK